MRTRDNPISWLMPLTLALMVGGMFLTTIPLALAQLQNEVEIVMKDRAFHITKGGTASMKGFAIVAGMPTLLTLRNEDNVAHEFVSPLLKNIPVKLVGEATTIVTDKASGFRIDPGKSVTLKFVAPVSPDFTTQYDLFWCNIHGKQHTEQMRGELLIVETRGEIM